MRERDGAVVDLRGLDLSSGGGASLEIEAPMDDLRIGGQTYGVPGGTVSVRVDLSRSMSGWFFRLRLEAEVRGPCVRCLEEARVAIVVDAREFSAVGRDSGDEFDEDLDSEYLEAERFDVPSWARDAMVEALPEAILCRDECAGLCGQCGANRNDGPCGCPEEPVGDPRWGALARLAEELGREGGSGST